MPALIILSIVSTWLLCAAVCVGIGGLLLRSFQFEFSLLEAFWPGLALIGATLQLYHFFRPIDLVAVTILIGSGIVGWRCNCRSLLSQLRELTKGELWSLLLCIPAVLTVAFRAVAPCEHYDTGLYGAQAIRWVTTYPEVPGLGNVLGELGLNSSIHLWMAVLDQGPWHHLSDHLFVGFLISALLILVIPAALRVFLASTQDPSGPSKDAPAASDWFLTLLIIPATISAIRGKIVGANTDLPTTIVCLVAAFMFLRGQESKLESRNADQKRRLSLVIAMLLFSLAVTFKISSIVFSFLGWVLASAKLWSLSRGIPERARLMTSAVILSCVLVLGWIARGLILTGYPFFPSTAFGIPVAWKMLAINAKAQADFARSFARIPQIPLADTEHWHWLRPWLRDLVREREAFLIPLFFATAGGIVALHRKIHQRQESLPPWLWLLIAAAAGLLFWLFEAPAIRFGEPMIWTAGATLGTLAAQQILDQVSKRRAAFLGLLLLIGWAAHPRLLWGSYFEPSVRVRTYLLLPQTKLAWRETASGLTVYVPIDTNQCWDAPLPCSPYFSDSLRLRNQDDMKRGFVSDGVVTDQRADVLRELDNHRTLPP